MSVRSLKLKNMQNRGFYTTTLKSMKGDFVANPQKSM
jgi:hypothetical protein